MDGSNWRRVDVSSNNGRRRRHRTGPATLHHPHRLARGLPPSSGIECYMHSIVTFFGFLRLPRFPLGPLTPTFTIPIDTYIVSPYTYIYSPDLRASCSIFIPTQDPAITSLRTTQALDEREFLPCAMAVLRVLLTPLSRQKVVQLPHSSMESRSTNEQCETLTSDHVTSALPSVEWRIMWVVGLVGVVCGVFHFSITKMFTYRSL